MVQKVFAGMKFGKLTTVEIVGKTAKKSNIWLCKCECGEERNVSSPDLLARRIRSCGCSNTQSPSKCLSCVREIAQCGFITTKPSLALIPHWEEQGMKIEIKLDKRKPNNPVPLFAVRECPWFM